MNNTTLLTLSRQYLTANQRYQASATNGRFKEMKAAEIELVKELEKWPDEVKEKQGGLF